MNRPDCWEECAEGGREKKREALRGGELLVRRQELQRGQVEEVVLLRVLHHVLALRPQQLHLKPDRMNATAPDRRRHSVMGLGRNSLTQ